MQIPEFLRIVQVHQNALEHARNLYRDRLAPDFNPFEFIDPVEIKLSRILAWLLNPQGSHGQGGRFLRLFLEVLGVQTWTPHACEQAKDSTEYWVGNGSIDVFVKSANQILAIENKPWAEDQTKQLCRYFTSLDKTGLAYHLVYLTEHGTAPPEHSLNDTQRIARIDKGQLHLWSYPRQLVEWLTRSRNECRADRVSVFLDEFSRYIRKEFQGVRDMSLQDHVVAQVTQSAEMVSPAMQIIFVADAIREKLFSMLRDQIEADVIKQGWTVDCQIDPYNRESSYLGVKFAETCQYAFGLQFEGTFFENLYLGIYMVDPQRPDDGRARAALLSDLGHGDEKKDWPWYRDATISDALLSVEPNWKSHPTPWIEIAGGEMARKVIDAASRFCKVLDQHGLI